MSMKRKEFSEFLLGENFEVLINDRNKNPIGFIKIFEDQFTCDVNKICKLYVMYGVGDHLKLMYGYNKVSVEKKITMNSKKYRLLSNYTMETVYAGIFPNADMMKDIYHLCFDEILKGNREYFNYVKYIKNIDLLESEELLLLTRPLDELERLYNIEYPRLKRKERR